MKKAPEAFRTISEVADILATPAHVLRFWESKFYQIRPVKRAGGRRYYRPDDVALINGIRLLLQDQGMTIRGVQRVLQDQGVKHVAALGSPLPLATDPGDSAVIDAQVADESVGHLAAVDVPATASAPVAPAMPVDHVEAAVGQAGADADRPSQVAEEFAPSEMSEIQEPADAAPQLSDVLADGDEAISSPMPTQTPDAAFEDVPPAAELPVSDAHEPEVAEFDLTEPDEVDATETGADAPADDAVIAALDTPSAAPLAAPDEEDTMTESDDLAPPAATEPQIDVPIDTLTDDLLATALAAASTRTRDTDLGHDTEIMEASDRAGIAQTLRRTPRGQLGPRKDALDVVARRIDTLLERMSEASGAGRW